MHDHGPGTNFCAIANGDPTDNHRIAADLHIAAYDWHIIRLPAVANGCAVAQGAIGADDGFFVNDKGCAVVEPEAGTNAGFVAELDAEFPFHNEGIAGQMRPPQPSQWPRQTVAGLGQPEHGKHKLTAGIPTIGFPILKDSRTHLGSPAMEVSFFMPEKYLPDSARREAWKSGGSIELLQAGKAACVQCWIYQTWVRLTKAGFPAKLVHEFPADGIVVALTGNLAPDFIASERHYVVGIVADGLPHPGVQSQIVQNASHARRLPGAHYMPLWTQPDLLPRDPRREDRFENADFFGDPPNLSLELLENEFLEHLKESLGVTLRIIPSEGWHDYQTTDCAIAVRDFAGRRHDHKPATKLTNAWLAGVPFLGGADSAFSSEGKQATDFFVCRTRKEFVEQMRALKTNADLRQRIVKAGNQAARRHTLEAHTKRWIWLLDEEIPKQWSSWQKKSAVERRLLCFWRRLRLALDRPLMG